MEDKALKLKTINDDDPRLTATIVKKKDQIFFSLHTNIYPDVHMICRSIWKRF